MKTDLESKLEKAKKRVAAIRDFYNHLAVYIFFNVVLFSIRYKVSLKYLNADLVGNSDFIEWLNWNVFGTVFVWGLALLVHAAKVFGWSPFFNKKWEERQIQKWLSEK